VCVCWMLEGSLIRLFLLIVISTTAPTHPGRPEPPPQTTHAHAQLNKPHTQQAQSKHMTILAETKAGRQQAQPTRTPAQGRELDTRHRAKRPRSHTHTHNKRHHRHQGNHDTHTPPCFPFFLSSHPRNQELAQRKRRGKRE
jgi:hypothetical protein